MTEIKFLYNLYPLYYEFVNEVNPILRKVDVLWPLNEVVQDYFHLCIARASDYVHYAIEDSSIINLVNPYINNGTMMNEWARDMHFDDFYMYTHESKYFVDNQLENTFIDTELSNVCVAMVSSLLKDIIINSMQFEAVRTFFHNELNSPFSTIHRLDIEPIMYNSDVYINVGLS